MIVSAFPVSEKEKIDGKQDKLTGIPGQVVVFDENGNATAQDAPDTGVTTFKGRSGAVVPETGDYTAEQVGASPADHAHDDRYYTESEIDTKLTSKSNTSHVHTAAEVGALPITGGTMSGTIISSLNGSDSKPDFQSSVFTKGSLIKLYMNGDKAAIRFGNGSTPPATADRILVRGVANPSDNSDAANKEYVDSKLSSVTTTGVNKLTTARTIDGVNFDGSSNIHHFGVCNTAAGTAAKTVTISNFVLAEGARILIYFANANTASSPTLNVSGTGAHYLSSQNGQYVYNGLWSAKTIVELVYYSNHWIITTARAERLAVARSIQTNLGSTSSAGFDGSSNITPGVTGTLPISNGGTGYTSAAAAMGGLTNSLSIETTVASDDYFPFRDTSALTGKKITAANLRNYLVPTWAQASSKPTYTASEVGALPTTGGTLTGNLRLKNNSNYGMILNFGDGDYVHISEPADDCLEIKAKKINFVLSDTSSARFTINGEAFSGGGSSGDSGTKIVTGTYAGNAKSASSSSSTSSAEHAISLGFRPKFVFVGCASYNSYKMAPWYYCDTSSKTLVSKWAGFAYDGYPLTAIQGSSSSNIVDCLWITSNGFSVRNASYAASSFDGNVKLNISGETYFYVAIG